MASPGSIALRGAHARWQQGLMLHFPLVWRLCPLRGLLLAAGVSGLAASVEPLVGLLGVDDAGRDGWYVSLYLLTVVASMATYLYWMLRRTKYPTQWLPPRVLARVAWLDVLLLLAFALPQAWFIARTFEPLGDPAVTRTLGWAYGGFWAYIVVLLFGMLGLQRLSAPWLTRLLARMIRWDLMLPAALRAWVARHEHRLAVDRPDLWRLFILRRWVVAVTILALTCVPVGAIVAATGSFAVGSAAIVYVAGMFLMLQTGMAVVVAGDQKERPKWRILALDAAVSAVGFTMLALAYEGVARAFLRPEEVRNFDAAALFLGSFWLALAAPPILLSRRARVLVTWSGAALVTAGFVVVLGDGRVLGLAILSWALAAAWLSRVRPAEAAFERAIGLAVGVLAFVPLLFVSALVMHFGEAWLTVLALLSSPALGWVLSRSALPVLRAARYWPVS